MKRSTRFLLVFLSVLVFGSLVYVEWRRVAGGDSKARVRKVLFYQDSMHPWIKSDDPGKCTICDMDLTPIYMGEKGFGIGEGIVVLSSNSITVLNVKCEEVKRRKLPRTLNVAGTLEANEARRVIISAPAASRIDALSVAYTGAEVQEGQVLITLFSPELVQKGRVLRAATLQPFGSSNDLSQAALNLNPFSTDLVAPMSGTVVERFVSKGQYVAEGERLLTIVDPSVLWFRFDVYEQQLPWFDVGQAVDVVTPAVPGKVFPATVAFIEPSINEATRTVKVRADIRNPVVTTNGHSQRVLRFGMYAEGRVRAEVPGVIAVPRTAVLFPGRAAYAYVDKGDGAYEMRQVQLGRRGDDLWEVLQGLDEGDRVVTSGNVLMDAQAQFNRGDKAAAEDCGGAAVALAEDAPAPRACAPDGGRAPDIPAAEVSSAAADPVPKVAPASSAGRRVRTRRESVAGFVVERERLKAMRQAAIAGAHGQAMGDATLLSPGPEKVTSGTAPEAGGATGAVHRQSAGMPAADRNQAAEP